LIIVANTGHTHHHLLFQIGTKRFDSEKAGDREVQRTMLELLNQLDGFSSTTDIKVNS
jgi:ATP-dependent 26S proteasome regulatory subunit